MNIFEELKRRNVFKAAISYLIFAWLILQIVSIVFPILQLSIHYQRWMFIILAIGFPAWVVFAYIYDWTPQGFKPTGKVLEEEKLYQSTNRRLNHLIIGGLSFALLLLVADRILGLSDRIIQPGTSVETIAVLPFSHESPEESDEFFTSGVHADVMTKLAGIQDFRIISKASVMPYRDFEGDLKELGKRLNAKFILEGSVRRWNEQIRISTQLVDTESNQAVWTHEYNGELENVFELQSSIATDIAQKLQADLSKGEKKRLNEVPTTVMAAYDDYLKARYTLNKPRATYDDILEAIDLLNNAVKADDRFSKAWTLLVQAHSEQYSKLNKLEGRAKEKEQALQDVEYALAKAKKLAPDNWELLSEEGFYHFYIMEDKLAALKSFEKAIEQNPSDVVSMVELAKLYINLGEVEKCIEMLENAFQLVQRKGFVGYYLSYGYEMNGDYGKMVPLLERLADLYPEEKHYQVEAKYYQFLKDGSLESFREFKNSVETADAENPWDERAIQNKEMVVAMFNNEFDAYHEKWEGKNDAHIKSHGEWMCPLVANEQVNHARLLLKYKNEQTANEILEEVNNIVLRPINRNSVCLFNPKVYLPKLDHLMGKEELARQNLEDIAAEVLQNESFPTGAVERAVLLQAADLIDPGRAYYYYELVVKNTVSMCSFESICADPWTYPNLIKDPRFVEEVRADGRFVEFLESFGFLKG